MGHLAHKPVHRAVQLRPVFELGAKRRLQMKKLCKFLGIIAIGAVLVIGLGGCDNLITDGEGYTFEFKVTYYSWIGWGNDGNITKIEFINGSSKDAEVLETKTVDIGFDEMSPAYRVSGFTEKNGDDRRIFGVKVTLADGSWRFCWSSAGNNAKLLLTINNYSPMDGFSEGSW
jgi:hypothetical protein